MRDFSWKNVKDIIGNTAPILGTLIGGPAGGAIGTVVASVLGVENNPDAIEKELATNPEALLKLKDYEFTHKEHLETLQLEETKAYLEDRKSARQRQVDHEKATGKIDFNLYFLAWTIVIGFFGLIGVIMFVQIPDTQNDIIYMLFGTLSAGFGAVMQYFFGSSKGSKEKTAQIAYLKGK